MSHPLKFRIAAGKIRALRCHNPATPCAISLAHSFALESQFHCCINNSKFVASLPTGGWRISKWILWLCGILTNLTTSHWRKVFSFSASSCKLTIWEPLARHGRFLVSSQLQKTVTKLLLPKRFFFSFCTRGHSFFFRLPGGRGVRPIRLVWAYPSLQRVCVLFCLPAA